MQQLTLFDTFDIGSHIKPGDWVKLLRKSTSAAYWKKGEIVKIESVHPRDGSVRFWNERAETWGYLHPDDIALVPPPLDSVSVQPIALDTESIAPPVDTESTPEPVEFDSVSVQPIALDTESTPEAVDFDSVSVQPIALDTESNCLQSETITIACVEVDTESNCPHSEFDFVSIVSPADTESTPEPVGIDSVSGPVATYRPKGTARGGEYFRFSYRAGSKMKHLHIPGENTGSVLAQSHATEVMELVAAGVPLLEICDRIKSWSKRNHLDTE
jgi:hypothetical protein